VSLKEQPAAAGQRGVRGCPISSRKKLKRKELKPRMCMDSWRTTLRWFAVVRAENWLLWRQKLMLPTMGLSF
jgi:hypothetical protein